MIGFLYTIAGWCFYQGEGFSLNRQDSGESDEPQDSIEGRSGYMDGSGDFFGSDQDGYGSGNSFASGQDTKNRFDLFWLKYKYPVSQIS